MSSQTQQTETIDLIAAHERALAELYQRYAARFAGWASLFRKLAEEERAHAASVAGLSSRMKQGSAFIGLGPLRAQAIRTSMEFVYRCTEEAQRPELTELAALSISHDLEEGAIEKRFFETQEADPPEVRALLQRLMRESEAHRALLSEAWEEARHRTR